MVKRFTFAALVFAFLASGSAHASSEKQIFSPADELTYRWQTESEAYPERWESFRREEMMNRLRWKKTQSRWETTRWEEVMREEAARKRFLPAYLKKPCPKCFEAIESQRRGR